MKTILRYDTVTAVTTPLNPLEDLTSWIIGLRSLGYTSDLLRTKHNITQKADIKQGSQLISLFSRNAVGLIEQAYSGPEEMSFLPLYYSLLNLSKVYIIASGRMSLLSSNRYHGGSYDPNQKSSRDLLTEEIALKQHGVLPLFYQSITNENWEFKNKSIKLKDIYPYVYGISHEFSQAYKKPFSLQQVLIEITETTENQAESQKLHITIDKRSDHPNAGKRKYLKLLKGKFKYDQDKHKFISEFSPNLSDQDIDANLSGSIRKYLIYNVNGNLNSPISLTPISGMQLLLPEELPIWLAFFHLSNVVRYNPEFISKLTYSKSWPMLLAMRKHTMLRFLILFWSFLHNSNYQLTNS